MDPKTSRLGYRCNNENCKVVSAHFDRNGKSYDVKYVSEPIKDAQVHPARYGLRPSSLRGPRP